MYPRSDISAPCSPEKLEVVYEVDGTTRIMEFVWYGIKLADAVAFAV